MRYAVIVLCVSILTAALFTEVKAQTSSSGYSYYVQTGDTWFAISQTTGVSVSLLQRTNPQAVRPYDLLYEGEILRIPLDGMGRGVIYHDVAAGESWAVIAQTYGIPLQLLLATNPDFASSPSTLSIGTRLLVPPQSSTDFVPVVEPTPFPDGVVVPPAFRLEDEPGNAVEAIGEAATELVPRPNLTEPLCPLQRQDFLPFFEEALVYWNQQPQGMVRSAEDCGLAVSDMIVEQDINGDGFNDLLITYGRQSAVERRERMDLALFHWEGDGLVLELRARAMGEVSLLAVGDVNEDGRQDLIWTDETCGESVCYTKVHVESWDSAAGAWEPWSSAPLAMVNADVKLIDAGDLGNGLAIQMQGGVHDHPLAGPQRARADIWASRNGQPFALLTREYGPTRSLYHVVMEAHQKTLESPRQNLSQAQSLYRAALADHGLETWHDVSEQSYLRAFSLWRLAIIASYQDHPSIAQEIVAVLKQAYPGSPFTSLSEVWLQAYTGSEDPIVACAAAQVHVGTNPATWQPFGAFGYANPGLPPSTICPVLDSRSASLAADELGLEPAPDPNPTPPPLFPSAEELRGMSPASFALSDDLPDCPGTLDGYPKMVESLLNGLGDTLLVETWMRLCGVMSDSHGTLQTGDLNADGHLDVVVIAAAPEPDGLGPGDMSGRFMVYYGSFAGVFNLIFQPPAIGLPSLLALEDVNEDGLLNLVWVDEVCNVLCLSSVEVLSWNGDHVNNHIRHDAVITNGTVRLAPVPPTNPGQGQQIVMEGGIGGLLSDDVQVSRVELWESVEGASYQRVWFEYDPADPDSRCLGLNLVEADAVMEGAGIYGYEPAQQMYQDILDNPTLTACSVTTTDPEMELALLKGLAHFRLIQAHALSGDMRSAILALETMHRAFPPEDAYVRIADAWRAAYAAHADPVFACQTVLPIVQAEPAVWQITGVFGLDHPSETETTLCFVPEAVP